MQLGRQGRLERLLARLPARPDPATRGTILCYHSIDRAVGAHASVTPEGLLDQLDWLTERAHVVPLAEIDADRSGTDDPRPRVAISFDDGYVDNHTHALPALRDRGLTATFFVTSGFIDGVADTRARMIAAWGGGAEHLRPLSWAQVREMADAGMEIGGHTRTHLDLNAASTTEALADVLDDKHRLEEQLGRTVTSFAYPFGRPGRHVTDATVELVAQAGYARAATVSFRRVSNRSSPLSLPRIPVNHDSPAVLAAKVGGRLDRLGRFKDGRALEVDTAASHSS